MKRKRITILLRVRGIYADAFWDGEGLGDAKSWRNRGCGGGKGNNNIVHNFGLELCEFLDPSKENPLSNYVTCNKLKL